VLAPQEHSFSFFDPPRCDGPLYVLPQMFLVNHAGIPLGVARGAIDTVVELSARKLMWPTRRPLREEGQVQEAVGVRKIKETVLRSLSVSLEEGFAIENENARLVLAAEDAKEGPRAFMEKRQPRYAGR
jgi:enoyl-CoA hydratase/carnithine racemase